MQTYTQRNKSDADIKPVSQFLVFMKDENRQQDAIDRLEIYHQDGGE